MTPNWALLLGPSSVVLVWKKLWCGGSVRNVRWPWVWTIRIAA